MKLNQPSRKPTKYLLGISFTLFFSGCAELAGMLEGLNAPANPEDKAAIDAASSHGILHFDGAPTGSVELEASAHIYVIYTNLSESQQFALPGGSAAPVEAAMSAPLFNLSSNSGDGLPPMEERYNQVPKHIRDFNNQKVTLIPAASYSLGGQFNSGSVGNPSGNVVGSTTRTWNTNDGPVPSTLRGSATLSNGKTLYVWVNDNAWSTNEAHNQRMTPARVNAVITGFATATPNIYDMTRKLYGEEWGPHNYGNIIPHPQNEIHIVYYDIGFNGAWGMLGYFWAVNNVLNHQYGNNALVFFMDSATMGLMQGGSWNTSLPGPAIMMTTLAHEFQHMIHFYEKQVVFNTASPVWLNELASTASEDILAHYITGPNSGPAFGDGSRLSQYARTPFCNITAWASNTTGVCNIFDSYAHVSSFGGFLARHYGGENHALFRELVRSNIDSVTGLGCAIRKARGQDCDNPALNRGAFGEAMMKWGTSLVLNPAKRNIPTGYGYPALTIPDYFGQGQPLVMHEANIWGFSSVYKPRIFLTPPLTILPLSNVAVQLTATPVSGSINLDTLIPNDAGKTALTGNSGVYKSTIVVQAP